jgi:hypothetical protein
MHNRRRFYDSADPKPLVFYAAPEKTDQFDTDAAAAGLTVAVDGAHSQFQNEGADWREEDLR